MDTKAIQARAPDARGAMVSVREPAPGFGHGSAQALLEDVRKLLRDGQIHDARQLAAEAMTEHPDHCALRRAHEVLNVGRSHTRPATGRSTREELEWLRDPPDEYRGKWVALIGRDVIGAADSLKELVARLPSDLEQTPLAVQIAS